MKRGIAFASGMVLAVAVSALFRFPNLGNRPLHCDEAVHGIKFGRLLQQRDYRYDPDEYHGPTLNYCTLPVAWSVSATRLTDVTEVHLRLVPALCGTGLVAITALLTWGLGRGAAFLAACLMAASPPLVFYSRYYIQEMLLVFFTTVALGALWRLARLDSRESAANTASGGGSRLGERPWFWAIVCGIAWGLMHATKETCILPAIAMFAALAGELWLYGTRHAGRRGLVLRLCLALAIAALVSATVVSCFGRHPQAVMDSYWTYANYLFRAGGEGSAGAHVYPPAHYLRLAFWYQHGGGRVWTELPVAALALVAAAASFRGQGLAANQQFATRFLCVYALAVWGAYSIIPYKTPWCMLGLIHPLLLLAGIGASLLLRSLPTRPWRAAGACILTALLGFSAYQAWWASFRAYEDPTNPFVYAHTTSDVPQLAQLIRELAQSRQHEHPLPVQVIAPDDDYWPLPWYLRELAQVGWYRDMPRGAPAPIIVAHAQQEAALNRFLYAEQPPGQRFLYVPLPTPQGGQDWNLRPGVPIRAYAQLRVWEAYRMDTLPE